MTSANRRRELDRTTGILDPILARGGTKIIEAEWRVKNCRSKPEVRVIFNRFDLARAGVVRTRCFAALEARERNGEPYLHVQTFYPELNPQELARLLDAKTAPLPP